jgi:hypothetical protein
MPNAWRIAMLSSHSSFVISHSSFVILPALVIPLSNL